ncbi:glycosyltransferase [uncultured Dokdonia sp.]|uniref:glycosyltransferase n=1 Tax=uncultured Dokdonia sp. TaxID=575653 RepID=UPI0030EDEB1E|tara:strand:+ start:34810 stop:35913 length:1104 start_codon:yes stop_codon:yes gene_type:complete
MNINIEKILIVLPGDKLAGSEKVLLSIAQEMYRRGIEINVLIWFIDPDKKGQWKPFEDDFNISYINDFSVSGFIQFIKYLRNIRQEKNDLTISSNIKLNGVLGFLRKFKQLSTRILVLREPSSPFLRYTSKFKILSYKLFYYLGYQSADFLVFQTDIMKATFFKNLPFKIKSDVFLNPVNYSEIVENSLDINVKPQNYGRYIVAAGRFIPEKGFELLIESFSLIQDKSIKLLILGSGDLEQSYRNLIKVHRVEDRVVFTGFVLNPLPYFKFATCCIVSSLSEGYPNTLLQMISLNSNVISTRCCGNLDEIPNLKLIPIDSIVDITKALDFKLNIDMDTHPKDETIIYIQNRNSKAYVDKLIKNLTSI